jgi:hypothetical protein
MCNNATIKLFPVIPKVPWTSLDIWSYMNIQENKILHLNCVNFFGSSKKVIWSGKSSTLLDQMSSEVQGTFGIIQGLMFNILFQTR